MIANDVEYLFMSLLVTCVPSCRKSIQILAQFLNLLSVVQFFYSDTSPVWLECFVGWGYSLWSSQLAFLHVESLPCEQTGVRAIETLVFSAYHIHWRYFALNMGSFLKKEDLHILVALAWSLVSITQRREQWEMLVTCPPREMPVALIWEQEQEPSSPWMGEARWGWREQVLTQVPQILFLLKCTQYS